MGSWRCRQLAQSMNWCWLMMSGRFSLVVDEVTYSNWYFEAWCQDYLHSKFKLPYYQLTRFVHLTEEQCTCMDLIQMHHVHVDIGIPK